MLALAVLLGLAASTQHTFAQSGTRAAQPQRRATQTAQPGSQSKTQPGSQTKAAANAVALQGYCPVCVIEMKKWVAGNPQHQVTFDGKTYLFPGEEQKQMFVANPAKYVPAFHGDCTVCAVNMGQRVPGTVQFPTLYQNRLFLFPSEKQKQEFRSNPEKYAQLDLALGGKCTVCRVEMQQDVQGKPEFATVYQGQRYLFPGEKQRNMFMANPQKYAVRPGSAPE